MHVHPIRLEADGLETVSAWGPTVSKAGGGTFGNVIQQFVADTNAQQTQADQAVQKLVTGQSDSIHETMLAMAKADLSFRLFVEVQSKVVEAYQEVMRMQM
jgi:flagellar hook-basal body complex protein FliE